MPIQHGLERRFAKFVRPAEYRGIGHVAGAIDFDLQGDGAFHTLLAHRFRIEHGGSMKQRGAVQFDRDPGGIGHRSLSRRQRERSRYHPARRGKNTQRR